MKQTIEDVLLNRGFYICTNVGNSMLPFIRQGLDILVIRPLNRPIKLYDVILTKRPSGRYILHRVIKINRDGSYRICGDNSYKYDDNILQESVVGLLDDIRRDDVSIMNKAYYKIFVLVWCSLFFFRKPLLNAFKILKSTLWRI